MGEYPNVITPRRLAVAIIRHRAALALEDAEASDYGSDDWVFFQRLAELLTGAAAFIHATADPPE